MIDWRTTNGLFSCFILRWLFNWFLQSHIRTRNERNKFGKRKKNNLAMNLKRFISVLIILLIVDASLSKETSIASKSKEGQPSKRICLFIYLRKELKLILIFLFFLEVCFWMWTFCKPSKLKQSLQYVTNNKKRPTSNVKIHKQKKYFYF